MKWIKVEEKLPEEMEPVLLFIDRCWDVRVVIGVRDEYTSTNGNRVIFQNYEPRLSLENVTHWMPLPEQPPIKEE